jgi:hypothetical protein
MPKTKRKEKSVLLLIVKFMPKRKDKEKSISNKNIGFVFELEGPIKSGIEIRKAKSKIRYR